MKKFFLVLLPLAALLCVGATIQWYSQQPVTTAPVDGDILALERPVPHGYKSFTLASLKAYLGANPIYVYNTITNYNYYPETFITNNSYVSNYWATNILTDNYVSNYFLTNLFFTNVFGTNFFYTNQVTYAWFTNLYFTNYVNTDNYVSNYFATNVFTTDYVSNYYYYTNFVLNSYTNYYTNTFLVTGPYILSFEGIGTNIGLLGKTVLLDSNFVQQAGFDGTQLWANNMLVNDTLNADTLEIAGLTASTLLKLDATKVAESVPNGTGVLNNDGSGGLSWSPVQTVISNSFTTNLITAKTAYITNIFYEGSFPLLSTWPGPTNSLNVSNQWQYATYTPCAITNFTGGVASHAADTSLSVSNAASSNVTFTITAADYWSGDFTNSYTLTNSERRTIAFRRIGVGPVEGLARWFQKMQ